MEILTLEGIYVEWPQIKTQKFTTFTAQLNLLNTLNNVNARKFFFSYLSSK